jgi:hypothetical protein
MSALLPLNRQRVPSCEDNSVSLILCISAGEPNNLPALFTYHLGDAEWGLPGACLRFQMTTLSSLRASLGFSSRN